MTDSIYEKGEKNYQDVPSAPVIQNDGITSNDFNQEQIYNKQNNQITINPEVETNNPTTGDNNDEEEDNIDNNEDEESFESSHKKYNYNIRRNYNYVNLSKCRLIITLILLSIPITSILLQIIFWNGNIFFFIDDFLIIGLSSLYLYYYFKRKNFNIFIGIITIIIWFFGAGMKGFALAKYYKIETITIIYMMLIFIRTGIIFCYIPITCS